MTMYDGRLNLSKQVKRWIPSKKKLFKTFIHRNVRLVGSSFGKPVLLYDANSTGAQYMNLTEEILTSLNGWEEVWMP